MPVEEKNTVRKKHSLILEDRKNLSLSGVNDVAAFDDEMVVLVTELGDLSVKGNQLHIDQFSVETGELTLGGYIDSLTYSENKQQQGGFFSRLFR